jgi:NAD(P)H-nitrite reductase large subunit
VQADALAVETGEAHSRTRLLLGPQSIVGAVVMGDQTLSRPLQHLINRQADIRPVRQRLLAEPAALGSTVLSFWKEWSVRAGIA